MLVCAPWIDTVGPVTDIGIAVQEVVANCLILFDVIVVNGVGETGVGVRVGTGNNSAMLGA